MESPPGNPVQELDAMRTVVAALEPLSPQARQRVLHWVTGTLAINGPPGVGHVQVAASTRSEVVAAADDTAFGFGSLAEFFGHTGPRDGSKAALVVGYWLQVVQGEESFSGQAVNSELKHLGHQQSNITSALSALIDQKPQLAVQLKKAGTTKQARKTYKVTSAGIAEVRKLAAGSNM